MSLLLRALHADPTWPEPLEQLRKLLWFRRPVALERILWKRLARAGWDTDEKAVAAAAARALSALYRSRLRDRSRARVLDKLAERIDPAGGSQPPAHDPANVS
jgi:hypothetical protein